MGAEDRDDKDLIGKLVHIKIPFPNHGRGEFPFLIRLLTRIPRWTFCNEFNEEEQDIVVQPLRFLNGTILAEGETPIGVHSVKIPDNLGQYVFLWFKKFDDYQMIMCENCVENAKKDKVWYMTHQEYEQITGEKLFDSQEIEETESEELTLEEEE